MTASTLRRSISGGTARPELARQLWGLAIAAVVACCLALGSFDGLLVSAATLPAGFTEEVVLSGLTEPSAVAFAPDGRVFVAEKSGLVKVFASLNATTATVFADLRTKTYNVSDRGMLGLTLHPNFPTMPYVYVSYAHDALIGGTAPRWGTAGATWDDCPTPPGLNNDGCVSSARVSRLTIQTGGNAMVAGSELVLVEDWCMQYPSHTIGALAFGADGALYASGGDGASFDWVDYGQVKNPCGDPPGGTTLTPPNARGGALRSQSPERPAGEPTVLGGTIIRIDPMTGAGLPDNPWASSGDANRRRIVAYGARNPFRFAMRPNTSELWFGDVGWTQWEEINRVLNPTAAVPQNFGWPCYEGAGRQAGYDGANLNICESLYSRPTAVTAPYFTYDHSGDVVAGENCPINGSAVSGMAFYNGGTYPAAYSGALFFADYGRSCIWAVLNPGTPAATVTPFVTGAVVPVELKIGPNGDLFYVDIWGGTIRRIIYGNNQAPVAVAQATPTSGLAPLTVAFDGSGSSDADAGDVLTYAWDLDADGAFDDSTLVQPSFTYTVDGSYAVRLRVTDNRGGSNIATVSITVGTPNPLPQVTIVSPTTSTTWKVNDTVALVGQATDDGPLTNASYHWRLLLHHCSTGCHLHPLTELDGPTASFIAPDHEYPSHIEVQLIVTDNKGGATTKSVLLNPQTVTLNFTTNPSGLELAVGSTSSVTPFTRTVIAGSQNSVSAVTPQVLGGTTFQFVSWSDGLPQTHNITVGTTPVTYNATFQATSTGGGGSTTYGAAADFSATQGYRNWYYLYGSGTQMTFNGTHWVGNETYLEVKATEAHPGAGANADAIRQWRAPSAGSITITGLVTDANTTCGDGVTAYIRKNGTNLWQQAVANGNTAGVSFNLTTTVAANDAIDFVVNKGAANDWCDLTGFNPTIVLTSTAPPTDSTPPVLSAGGPSGALDPGTSQATLTVATNEPSTCRYSTTSGLAFTAMPNTFSSTGGVTHSTLLTGLPEGGHSYFVRCSDPANNATGADYVILFGIGESQAQIFDAAGDFSGTQGYRNWYYLYGAGTPMTFNGTSWQGSEAYIQVTPDGAHPGATVDAIRQWRAPNAGIAAFAGFVFDLNAECGDGVTALVRKNGTTLWQQAVVNGAPTGIPFNLATTVVAGDNIDFVVNKGAANDWCDLTGFDTTVFLYQPVVPSDTTPPARSNGAPTNVLAAGTTQATLTLTTDENAVCRYGTTSGVAYASLPTQFTTTGSTSHATTVSGLTNGTSYVFFVRCQDTSGNPNTDDYAIAFSVASPPADSTPPVRSNGTPTGTLAAGTVQATLGLTTNEAAACRYGTTAGVAYGSLPTPFTTTGGTSHATTVTGLANGTSYTYYVRCQDIAGNPNTTDFSITFSVAAATTPVTANPSGVAILTGTLNGGTAASLVSDNNAYYAVNSTTSGTRTTAWYGSFANVNAGLSTLRVNYKGNNSASCTQTIAIYRWTTSSWVQLDSRSVGTTEVAINNLAPTGTLTDYRSATGELRVRVQCTRTGNFIARGDLMSITYNQPAGPPSDTTPPVRSNGTPTGALPSGTTTATLALTTSENAVCRYSTSPGIAYGTMSGTFSTTGGAAHTTSVGPLANGGNYTYYVRCQDAAGNPNPDDYAVAFSVGAGGQPQTFVASADFSATQGFRNWYYLYGSGTQMTFNGTHWVGNETYLEVKATEAHPGAGANADAIRQWRAPGAGSITITGIVSDANVTCGDGVTAFIRKNGTNLWQQSVANGNTAGVSFNLTTIVAPNDTIDFVVNKGAANDWCDLTGFNPTVVLTP